MTAGPDVKARVATCLRDEMMIEGGDHDDLVESGALDSMQFLVLFQALEREFDIVFETDDLVLDHFRTVATITRFVVGKLP